MDLPTGVCAACPKIELRGFVVTCFPPESLPFRPGRAIRSGTVLEKKNLPRASHGQTAWFTNQKCTGTETPTSPGPWLAPPQEREGSRELPWRWTLETASSRRCRCYRFGDDLPRTAGGQRNSEVRILGFRCRETTPGRRGSDPLMPREKVTVPFSHFFSRRPTTPRRCMNGDANVATYRMQS